MIQSTKETLEKVNRALEKAQAWLGMNYPSYAQAFIQLVKDEERKGSNLYYGIMGIIIRMEQEGEENFVTSLSQEYILTSAVREKVKAIIDSSANEDARIDAWEELKKLVGIK